MKQSAARQKRLDMAQHTARISFLTSHSDAAAISLSRGNVMDVGLRTAWESGNAQTQNCPPRGEGSSASAMTSERSEFCSGTLTSAE
jgi:hypothetical protein